MASNGAEDFQAQAFGPGLTANAKSATARMSTSSNPSKSLTRTVSYTQSPRDHALQLHERTPLNQKYYFSGMPAHRACLGLSPSNPRGKEAFTANASGNGLSHGGRLSSVAGSVSAGSSVAPSVSAGSSMSFTASQSSWQLGAPKNSFQTPGPVKSLQLRPGLFGKRSLSSQQATSAVVGDSMPNERLLPWSANKLRLSNSSRATSRAGAQDQHCSGDKEFQKLHVNVKAGSGLAEHLLKCHVSYEGAKGLGAARDEMLRVPFTVAIERLIENGSLLRNGMVNNCLTGPLGRGSDPRCVVEVANTGSTNNLRSSAPAPPCLTNGDEQSRCFPDGAFTAPGIAAGRHSLTAASASAVAISEDADSKGACLKQASVYSVTNQLTAVHLTDECSPLLQQGELSYSLPPLEDHSAMGLRVLTDEAVSMSLDEVEEEDLPDEMEGHSSGDDDDGCDCSSMIHSSSSRSMEASSNIEDPATPILEEGRVLKPALVPSLFPLNPPTLYFATAKERVELLPAEQRKFLKWKMSSVTPHVVKHTVARSHFKVTKKSHDWLGCWGHHMKSVGFRTLREYQKLNHFPGSFQIGRKDRLWRNLSKMQAHFGKQEFGFLPRSFVLPQDIKLLRKAWDSTGSRQKWIIKPPASARGIGIQVIHKWSQLPNRRPLLVQKYLHKPYLISGNKFDLRIYVYVTSYDPLRVYIFSDGLVRFASCKYSSSLKSLSNKFMHLTNYSVNKKNSEYQSNSDDKACQGHKWALKALWQYLGARGVNTVLIWEKIKDIVVKTIIASDPYVNTLVKMHVRSPYSCHELFGFDIMLDEHLRPWLLEVNISPSLHSNSALDANIKGQMMRDLMNLAGFVLPMRDDPGSLKSSSVSSSASSLGGGDKEKSRHTGEILSDEKVKRAHFLSQNQRSTNPSFYSTVLDVLTPRDVRVLTEAEDELCRRGEFERVFPSPTSSRYLRFFEQPRYLNILLNQWEQKYWNNRSKGINLLRSLCQKGVHLGSASYLPHPWSVLSFSNQRVDSWSTLSIKEEPIRPSVVVSHMHSARKDEEDLPLAVSSPPDTGTSTPTGLCSPSCESLPPRDFI